MSLRAFLIALLVSLLPAWPVSGVTDRPVRPLGGAEFASPQTGEFAFAVIGDFRMARRDRPYHAAFKEILKEIKMIGPRFVVSTGDGYYGYGGSFQRFKNEVDHFLSSMMSLDVPVFAVVGNHDVTDEPGREGYVREKLGEFFGSFDAGPCHFVILNTEERGREGSVAAEQLEWLKRDLEANKQAAHVFVFLHRPLFSVMDPEFRTGRGFRNKAERDDLHAIFARYKVKLVIAGDEHLFSDTTYEGVRYIISGGSGAPLYKSPPKGGFFHYLLIQVKGEEVSVAVLEPYALETRPLSGNDGFEPRSEVEVVNLSPTPLPVRNIPLMLPRAGESGYTLRAVVIPPKGPPASHPARLTEVRDNSNGTATVGVETHLPGNSVLRISVDLND